MASPTSADSLNPASLEVPAVSVAFTTPPGVAIDHIRLSLCKDIKDVSESDSTICDLAADTLSSENGPNAPDASPATDREFHANQGDHSPLSPVSNPARRLQGTTLPSGGHSEHPFPIPYVMDDASPGGENGSPNLEARTAWSGDSTNVKRWKEEIDMLLVFAGLFSAVVTGFLTEASKSLRPAEPMAGTVAILAHISAQLRQGSEDVSALAPGESFVPDRRTVQVNCLWFVSLLLCLGVAFVSILVKWRLQGWHSSGLSLRPTALAEHARAHYLRAFHTWRVQAIMTTLPVLLLFALVLFCAGLAILLLALDVMVGIVAVCMIGFIFLLSFTTIVFFSV